MTNNSNEFNKNSDIGFNNDSRTGALTIHNLKAFLILRIEAADDEDEHVQMRITDSIGKFLECNAPARQLAEAFLENHYPELLKK